MLCFTRQVPREEAHSMWGINDKDVDKLIDEIIYSKRETTSLWLRIY